MRVIFATGKLETMDYFTGQMKKACDKYSVDSFVLDLNDPGSFQNDSFFAMLDSEECVAFFFNHIGLGLMMDGRNMWEKYHIPVYDFIVDHPRNFPEWLADPIEDLHLIVLDRNHKKFVQRFFPKVKDVIFMPDGGSEEDIVLPYEDRPIDVLYMGSCQQKIDTFPIIDFMDNNGYDFFVTTINTMAQYPELTTEEAIDLYTDQVASGLSEEQKRMLHIDYAHFIEIPIRRHFKQLGMRALSEAGVKVEVYGYDWLADDYEFGDNIKIHSFIPSKDCNLLAGQAKICLNFMPWFKDGSSERVFNSMLNGAVSISDRSTYLTEHYTDGKDIVYYDLKNPEQMVMDIQWLLAHPTESKKIAEAGYDMARSHDSWECRFKTFMRYLGVDL